MCEATVFTIKSVSAALMTPLMTVIVAFVFLFGRGRERGARPQQPEPLSPSRKAVSTCRVVTTGRRELPHTKGVERTAEHHNEITSWHQAWVHVHRLYRTMSKLCNTCHQLPCACYHTKRRRASSVCPLKKKRPGWATRRGASEEGRIEFKIKVMGANGAEDKKIPRGDSESE